MVCIEGKIIRKRYEKRIRGFNKIYIRLWNRKYPVFQGLQALPQQDRFETQIKENEKGYTHFDPSNFNRLCSFSPNNVYQNTGFFKQNNQY